MTHIVDKVSFSLVHVIFLPLLMGCKGEIKSWLP